MKIHRRFARKLKHALPGFLALMFVIEAAIAEPVFDVVAPDSDVACVKPEPNANDGKAKPGNSKNTAAPNAGAGWTPVFNDDFEGRTKIGKAYTTARGHDDSWSVFDGILIGKQTKDDHGAVIRTELPFKDVDIQFDFRFSGGERFNFVIDDKNEKSVHAGHICRASVSPRRLNISDDKTGGMNLKVRKMRQDENLPPEGTKKLKGILSRTQSAAKINLKSGQWHTLRIRIEGDVMKAFLDQKLIASLRSPGFAHPTKTKFGFTVTGSTIDFDNVRVLTPRAVKSD